MLHEHPHVKLETSVPRFDHLNLRDVAWQVPRPSHALHRGFGGTVGTNGGDERGQPVVHVGTPVSSPLGVSSRRSTKRVSQANRRKRLFLDRKVQ